MYYIKNKNELVGKTIKDAILGGVVNIGESWNANNNLIIVTEDNGVFVSCVQPDYVGDEEDSDNDSVFISPMPEDAFMRMLAENDKVCL